jgi:hypothetical protein
MSAARRSRDGAALRPMSADASCPRSLRLDAKVHPGLSATRNTARRVGYDSGGGSIGVPLERREAPWYWTSAACGPGVVRWSVVAGPPLGHWGSRALISTRHLLVSTRTRTAPFPVAGWWARTIRRPHPRRVVVAEPCPLLGFGSSLEQRVTAGTELVGQSGRAGTPRRRRGRGSSTASRSGGLSGWRGGERGGARGLPGWPLVGVGPRLCAASPRNRKGSVARGGPGGASWRPLLEVKARPHGCGRGPFPRLVRSGGVGQGMYGLVRRGRPTAMVQARARWPACCSPGAAMEGSTKLTRTRQGCARP